MLVSATACSQVCCLFGIWQPQVHVCNSWAVLLVLSALLPAGGFSVFAVFLADGLLVYQRPFFVVCLLACLLCCLHTHAVIIFADSKKKK